MLIHCDVPSVSSLIVPSYSDKGILFLKCFPERIAVPSSTYRYTVCPEFILVGDVKHTDHILFFFSCVYQYTRVLFIEKVVVCLHGLLSEFRFCGAEGSNPKHCTG